MPSIMIILGVKSLKKHLLDGFQNNKNWRKVFCIGCGYFVTFT